MIGTAAANIVMAYIQFRRLRIGFNGNLEGGKTLMISARVIVVSAVMAVIARLAWDLLHSVFGGSIIGQIISVGCAVLIAAAFYAWAISHMRITEWDQIESMFRRRLGI